MEKPLNNQNSSHATKSFLPLLKKAQETRDLLMQHPKYLKNVKTTVKIIKSLKLQAKTYKKLCVSSEGAHFTQAFKNKIEEEVDRIMKDLVNENRLFL